MRTIRFRTFSVGVLVLLTFAGGGAAQNRSSAVLNAAEVQQLIAKQIKNAQDFCTEVAAARLSMRGCPVKTTVDR